MDINYINYTDMVIIIVKFAFKQITLIHPLNKL
jgi:hypothetical protein